jgi:subtilase family serine protease
MRLTPGGMCRYAIAAATVLTTALLAPATATTAATASATATTHNATSTSTTTATPIPAVASSPRINLDVPAPLTTAQCLARVKVRCYSPLQYQTAYDLKPLYDKGIKGTGRTIVIVDSFGSPTIGPDLGVFDKQWGLPNFTLNVYRLGVPPKFNPNNASMRGWAAETTLDVEYAHAIAPGATIDLVETPVAETEGVQGFPQMMEAEAAMITMGKGDVISQSFGATENTFPGFAQHNYQSLNNLRFAFEDAAAHNVTVLASSGDNGATDSELNGSTLYRQPADSWPSSDPLVTSVGGTELYLNASGMRTSPDTAWNDGYGASGGGLSGVFERPFFQNGVASVVGNHRGTPDVAMSAAVSGAAWVYSSYQKSSTGWQLYGGTSEATPLFAGIVALADQVAGHRLGNINEALYALGAENDPAATGIINVTKGDNSFGGVQGYKALPGYNLVTGWGTIDAAKFVYALANFVPPPAPILVDYSTAQDLLQAPASLPLPRRLPGGLTRGQRRAYGILVTCR